jgi:hypothetical protein
VVPYAFGCARKYTSSGTAQKYHDVGSGSDNVFSTEGYARTFCRHPPQVSTSASECDTRSFLLSIRSNYHHTNRVDIEVRSLTPCHWSITVLDEYREHLLAITRGHSWCLSKMLWLSYQEPVHKVMMTVGE